MSNILKDQKKIDGSTISYSLKEFGETLIFNPSIKSNLDKTKQFDQDFQESEESKTGFLLGEGFSFNLFHKEEELAEKKEAKSYLDFIEKQAVNIEKEAFKKGREEGRAKGMQEMKQEFTPVIEAMKKGITDVCNLKDGIYKNSQNEILNLVMLIASKVIKREIEIGEDVINNVVKWAVGQMIDKDEMTIKINPDDMETAARFQEDLRREVEGLKGVILESDSSITRGGCIIETNFGSVDARIEPQLNEIEKSLRNAAGVPNKVITES